jgi:DNA recombination protein RmuC
MFDHLSELQRRLDGAVQAHNAAIGSLESRVLPAARRFKDLGIRSAKEMAEPGPVDHQPRMLQAPEAAAALGAGAVDGELLPADSPHDDR